MRLLVFSNNINQRDYHGYTRAREEIWHHIAAVVKKALKGLILVPR